MPTVQQQRDILIRRANRELVAILADLDREVGWAEVCNQIADILEMEALESAGSPDELAFGVAARTAVERLHAAAEALQTAETNRILWGFRPHQPKD
jgi:hypothetical protein